MHAHDEDFAEFVRDASPRLLRTAWFICGDPHQAEDLVQSALEKVYLRWSRLRDGQPVAYARRCLMSQHIDTGRRTKELLTTTGDVADRAAPEQPIEDTSSLVAMLSTLPLRERQVVVLRHYVGLTEAQTAESLGVSVGTVKSSASRGLARLRTHLTTEEQQHV